MRGCEARAEYVHMQAPLTHPDPLQLVFPLLLLSCSHDKMTSTPTPLPPSLILIPLSHPPPPTHLALLHTQAVHPRHTHDCVPLGTKLHKAHHLQGWCGSKKEYTSMQNTWHAQPCRLSNTTTPDLTRGCCALTTTVGAVHTWVHVSVQMQQQQPPHNPHLIHKALHSRAVNTRQPQPPADGQRLTHLQGQAQTHRQVGQVIR